MKQRYITSVVYVVVWLALCAMKWLVPDGWGSLGFDAVFCAISVLGSLELLRALKGVSYPQKIVTVAFCAVVVPLYVATQMAVNAGFIAVASCFCLYALVLAALNVFNHGTSTVKGTATCFFTMLYCGVLSVVLSAVNHVAHNSMAAIITLFLTIMLTDSLAFVFGISFGRFAPLKLAPKLSPNKTVIGGAGGIIGGMIGAVAAYFIYFGLGKVIGTPLVYEGSVHPAVVFMLIGLVTSVIAQIGDLFESAIKRECNIKDTGRLLPGHGGVLDRFDSMLFSAVVVLLGFTVIIV
ncbi:MAG: phosphatidate cytidylyltransferase [Clostridia bacterium]|nr:phosphatidate cytidylyltransferase [Clostridia bacterium]MDE7306502.1 phosphatidate cytidylyltransferase [Clostridia bacterium]